jgi:short-subunit dehydrogenase
MKEAAPKTRQVVVITGASAGIGAALARVFAEHDHDLVLIARREGKLDALADEIAATGRRRPLVLPVDLTQPDAAGRIKSELAAHALEPQYIVNNAGFGLVGEAAQLDHLEQLAMIDLNIRFLTELSLAFVDTLSRSRGGILNVASVAGFLPGPGMAVYYATKAYVLSFSEALHHELMRRGVRVTVLCPGPVPTEFQARAGIPRVPFPSRNGMPRVVGSPALTCTAQEVSEAGYVALMRGRRVVVPGFGNKAVTLLTRLLPRRVLLEAVGHSQMMRARGSDRVLKKAVREAP